MEITRNPTQRLWHARLAALGASAMLVGAAGCATRQSDGGPPPSAATASGGAAGQSPFGKTSSETKLPPQGKPPTAEELAKRGQAGQPALPESASRPAQP
jgi:hypothetical protein